MLERLYPDDWSASVQEIDFASLYREGYRAVIFDIDNTLVPHGMPADEGAVKLFRHLRELGYQTMLLSNNKEPRVRSFAQQVGSDYIYKAGKPGSRGYLEAVRKMQVQKAHTLFVGDQLFTDIWGANRTGIRNILVQPIHPKEEIQIVLKRLAEKVVLFFYFRRKRKG